MSDFSVLLLCITALILSYSWVRFQKWRLKQETADKITELELELEVSRIENDRLNQQLKYYSSSLSDLDEKGKHFD